MSQRIDTLIQEVQDWFSYQTYKIVHKSHDREPSYACNMLNKKKNYLQMIFGRVKNMFLDKIKNYCFIGTKDNIKWKEKL